MSSITPGKKYERVHKIAVIRASDYFVTLFQSVILSYFKTEYCGLVSVVSKQFFLLSINDQPRRKCRTSISNKRHSYLTTNIKTTSHFLWSIFN